MALLFEDGFGKYSTTASNLDRKWTRSDGATVNATQGAFGGPCADMQVGAAVDALNSNESNHPAGAGTFGGVLSSGGTAHAAFWMRIYDMPSGETPWLGFSTNLQGQNSLNGYFSVDNLGALRAKRHGVDANITNGTSANGVIISNQWHHIELSCKWNTSANGGVVKVWVDGVLVINTTGNDTVTGTVPSTFTVIRFAFGTGSSAGYLDDVVVWDETGTNFTYTQLGIHRIEEISPDANDTVQFTPSAGSNFQNVDDTTFVDSDTTYNEASSIGQDDLFTLGNLSSTPVSVFACVPNIYSRKTDIGGVRLKTRVRSGSTHRESPERPQSTSYLFWSDYTNAALNPDTGIAWGSSDPNSLKLGYVWVGDVYVIPVSNNLTFSSSAPTVV